MSRFEELPERVPGTPDAATPPPWTEPHLPAEAERMGLMPVTAPELAFASALKPNRRGHRIIAWIGLATMALTGLSGLVGWLRSLGVIG